MSDSIKKIPLTGTVPPLYKLLKPVPEDPANDRIIYFHLLLKDHDDGVFDKRLTRLRFDRIDEFIKENKMEHKDIEQVTNFYTEQFNFTVVDESPMGHIVSLSGTLKQCEEAFGIKLQYYLYRGIKLLGHTEEAQIPESLAQWIEGVSGLAEMPPIIRWNSRIIETQVDDNDVRDDADPSQKMSSLDYAKLYKYPTTYNEQSLDGKDQIYGLIAMGGDWEVAKKDIALYCEKMNIEVPVIKTFVQEGFESVSSSISNPNDKAMTLLRNNGELSMDIQVPLAIIPRAVFHVYMVRQDFSGLSWGISTALFGSKKYPKSEKGVPNVLAISWSFPEIAGNASQYEFLDRRCLRPAAILGMPIFASSGDWGSSNNTNPPALCVSGPASSPYVIAVGGTRMELKSDLSFTEQIWAGKEEALGQTFDVASGGGFSNMFEDKIIATGIRSQKKNVTKGYLDNVYEGSELSSTYAGKVGVPDISAISTSNLKGYFLVLSGVPGQYPGGTSAAAPMWAALFTLYGEALKKRFSNARELFYTKEFLAANPLNNIVDHRKANNSLDPEELKDTWKAADGWDPCTGLGTPNGEGMLKYLAGLET